MYLDLDHKLRVKLEEEFERRKNFYRKCKECTVWVQNIEVEMEQRLKTGGKLAGLEIKNV